MGLFGFFKKKKQPSPAVPHAYGQDSTTQAARQAFQEPIRPIEQLRPQELDKPSSFDQAEMQIVLNKLDLISTRLEMINQRLANLEQSMQSPQTQQVQHPKW